MGLFYFLPLFCFLAQLLHSVCHQWVLADAQICAANALYQCSDPRGATIKRLPRGASSPLWKRHLQLTELWSSDLRRAAAARHTRQPQRRAATKVRRRDVGVVSESNRVLLGPVSTMSDQQPPPQGAFSPTAIPKVVTDKQRAIQILRGRLHDTFCIRHHKTGDTKYSIRQLYVENDGMLHFICARMDQREAPCGYARVATSQESAHLCQVTFLDEEGNPTIAVEANVLDLAPAPTSALRESTNTAVAATQLTETMDVSGDAIGADLADHSTSAAADSEAATEPDATKKKSKYRYVYCNTSRERELWHARVCVKGSPKTVYTGPSEEEAARAVDKALKKAVNFPVEAPPPPEDETPLETLVRTRSKELDAISERLRPKTLSKSSLKQLTSKLTNSAVKLNEEGSTSLGLDDKPDGVVVELNWSDVDAAHLPEIERNISKVSYIKKTDPEFVALGGRGIKSHRTALRMLINDMLARRDQRDALAAKRERAAMGPYATKGIDYIWNADDGERVDSELSMSSWLDGGGDQGVWKAMLEKEKEARKRKREEEGVGSSLASSEVERPTKQTEFYKDTGATKRMVARDPSVQGVPSDLPLKTYVPSKFENVHGTVTTSGILYGYVFSVWNRGQEWSGLVYTTEQAAWEACRDAMANYDWPVGRPDFSQLAAIRQNYMLNPDHWDLVCQGLAKDPRAVMRFPQYAEPDSRKFWFHATSLRNLDSIMADGVDCCALEDVAGSGVAHSKLPKAVWGSSYVYQCRDHMLSKDTIDRHVSNGLTTYATWNKVALIAIRMEGSGWKKVQTPYYPQSGCTFQPVVAFAGRAFDVAEDGSLEAMRAWAASL